MSYFIRNGNTYRISAEAAVDIKEQLPVGNYIIQKDSLGNLFLEEIDGFTAPKKIYGDCTKNANRIVSTFLDRSGCTGVLLNGEKGSGKTLLARQLSITLAQRNIPTVVINQPWVGDEFNRFLQLIEQPCMILFDEFEKVYDEGDQEKTLTLLDGVFPSNKLFVFTVNDRYRVNQHMRNRPGRIYYNLEFTGLDHGFIRDYCQDQLVNKSYIERIVDISNLFSQFNFDMLKALVEEMNRYNESPQEALKILNAKPENDDGAKFEVEIEHKGQSLKLGEDAYPEDFRGNPLKTSITVNIVDGLDDDGDRNWKEYQFSPEDLILVKDGKFVYVHNAIRLTLTRKKDKVYDYYNVF